MYVHVPIPAKPYLNLKSLFSRGLVSQMLGRLIPAYRSSPYEGEVRVYELILFSCQLTRAAMSPPANLTQVCGTFVTWSTLAGSRSFPVQPFGPLHTCVGIGPIHVETFPVLRPFLHARLLNSYLEAVHTDQKQAVALGSGPIFSNPCHSFNP